jgi:FG-GAP-like repeat
MRRREGSRKYQIFAIMVIGLWLPCQVLAADIDVYVGYADNIRPATFFPAPWLGDPGILDVGHAIGQTFDAGAIRIDNNTGAAITVDNVTVDGFANGASFSLWGSFTIPSGMKAILTQTDAGDENFDTSDQTDRPCCTRLGFGVEPFPKVRITIGGQTTVFGDTAHVLDTGGFDIKELPPGNTNESHRWRLIGTTGGQGAQPTAHDFDGDGKADILWRHSNGQVYIWLMDGLAGQDQGSQGQIDLAWQIAEAGDFDGDGKADILWRHSTTGQVNIWLMNGLVQKTQGSQGQIDPAWQIQP